MKKLKLTMILVMITFFMGNVLLPMSTVFADEKPVTVILSSQDDAYYSLAEEIADAEGLNIYTTFEEAAAVKPTFLLWVMAPENISEQVLLEFSLSMKEYSTNISTGIISGQTIDDARSLWRRGRQHLMPANDYAIVNGNGATQKIVPEIIVGDAINQETTVDLSYNNLLDVLGSQSNVQITVEGTATSWFDQHADINIHAEDIPALNDTLVMHYGCSTFRPWVENSIAIACIHQGAAAYMGFIEPSIVGSRFGDYDTNGLLYTWEKFPIGHLVQVQNEASMQSYVELGHFFLLGDPRIYRQGEMPYTLIRDETSGNERVIEISNVPAGLIPVHIPNGADYTFVSINGLSSSTMNSNHFNRYVQMMNINEDKFVVIENTQDRITIELSKKSPLMWEISSSSIKFMDLIIVDGHNNTLYILLIGLIFVLMVIRFLRKRINKRHLFIGAGFGLFMAVLISVLTLLRVNHIEVTNVSLDFDGLFLLGVFACTTYGLMLYLDAKDMKGKISALLVANLSSLVTLLIFMVALGIRFSMGGNGIAVEKITYPWLFPLQKLLLGLGFYTLIFELVKRLFHRNDI